MAIRSLLEEPVNIRCAAAKDPNAREPVLRELADDGSAVVRTFVYNNPNTPEDIKDSIEGILRPYCVEVRDAQYWYDSWDFEYYIDKVCPNFTSHAVVISPNYDVRKARWWEETVNTLVAIEDNLGDPRDAEDFITKARIATDDSDSELYGMFDNYDDYDLTDLFNLYEDHGCWVNPDIIAKALPILQPEEDICVDTIYDQHGNGALVVYDEYVDLDVLRPWLFGEVYDLILLYLDFDDIADSAGDMNVWDIYAEYGREQDAYMLTRDEFVDLCGKGISSAIPEYFGLTEDECEVSGDI